MLSKKSSFRFSKLAHSLFEGFTKFMEETKEDRFESFRVAAHNITKFAAEICPYISSKDSEFQELDSCILEKKVKIFNNLLSSENNIVCKYFSSLMDVYNEYWKSRNTIVSNIIKNDSLQIFKEEMNNSILLKLLEIVDTALNRDAPVESIINFFRLYNEFLEHFKCLEFTWLVSKSSLDELSEEAIPFCVMINKDTNSYRVLKSEEFVKYLKLKNIPIPKHYFIEILRKLLNTVIILFSKDWSDSQKLTAVSEMLLAIGHSLIHFKSQADNIDFENFLSACTFPFESIVLNCSIYWEFKKRLESVENFYLYTRKQNEIGVENAVQLCLKESFAAAAKGFLTNINSSNLKESYDKYLKKYLSLMDQTNQYIIQSMRKLLADIPRIDQWTPRIKRDIIPLVLACLSAIWTNLESVDVASIGEKLKPHCVQILCIFRMLGIDNELTGVSKHFSQVLTGQGKSIILGLLSALLAITGHTVHSVCYSNYLAKRDQQAFGKFFRIFEEFSMNRKVEYSKIDNVTDKILSPVINNRTENIRSLVEKLIMNELPSSMKITSNETEKCILLIDEADVFFSEDFYGTTYGPLATIKLPELLDIQPKIWEIVREGVHDQNIVFEKINEFINTLLIDSKNKNLKQFLKSNSSLFKKNIKQMISNAIEISKDILSHNLSDKYKINDVGIISNKDSFGFYSTNIYIEYYNIFYYFMLKETDFDHKNYSNYGYITMLCGRVSYSNLPKEYSLILGVSGTLTTLNDSEIEAIKSYGIDTMTVMPSFFGDRKLKFNAALDFVIENTEQSWMEKIHDHVNKRIGEGRAVLVFFQTKDEIDIFNEKFRNKIDRLHILTGNENSSTLEEYINEAGLARTVTLATRNMGRGVDFKSNDLSVEQNGGTHVIQTFFSLDEKEEIQIKGRTARKDNKGSYELIICMEHLKKLGCNTISKRMGTNDNRNYHPKVVTNYQELCEIRKTKADLKGAQINANIKKSEEKHNLMMNFLKSFNEYTPNKRETFLSNYQLMVDKTK